MDCFQTKLIATSTHFPDQNEEVCVDPSETSGLDFVPLNTCYFLMENYRILLVVKIHATLLPISTAKQRHCLRFRG